MSSYYTQAVFINEVPDFLSIEKISYSHCTTKEL